MIFLWFCQLSLSATHSLGYKNDQVLIRNIRWEGKVWGQLLRKVLLWEVSVLVFHHLFQCVVSVCLRVCVVVLAWYLVGHHAHLVLWHLPVCLGSRLFSSSRHDGWFGGQKRYYMLKYTIKLIFNLTTRTIFNHLLFNSSLWCCFSVSLSTLLPSRLSRSVCDIRPLSHLLAAWKEVDDWDGPPVRDSGGPLALLYASAQSGGITETEAKSLSSQPHTE